MTEDYHGWDQEEGYYRFADVIGHIKNESVFVIDRFGDNTSPRQALSAIMSAMAQFHDRIQVEQSEVNNRLICKLKEAQLVRAVEIQTGERPQWVVLSATARPPRQKKPWWVFWSK